MARRRKPLTLRQLKARGIPIYEDKKSWDKNTQKTFICRFMTYEGIVAWTNELFKKFGSMTIRQLFYQFVSKNLLSNRRRTYASIDRYLIEAREKKHVDWRNIADSSRAEKGGDFGYDSPTEWYDDKVVDFKKNDYYRFSWSGQPKYLEIWVEKDALFRLVYDVAKSYQVKVCSTHGSNSLTALCTSMERIAKEGKRCLVLHLADLDPSGEDMSRDLVSRGISYNLNRLTKGKFRLQRIALNDDQVEKYKLPPNPTKSRDPRTPSYANRHGNRCWELDAIPPEELKKIIENAIRKNVNWKIWEENKQREIEEREEAQRLINNVDL